LLSITTAPTPRPPHGTNRLPASWETGVALISPEEGEGAGAAARVAARRWTTSALGLLRGRAQASRDPSSTANALVNRRRDLGATIIQYHPGRRVASRAHAFERACDTEYGRRRSRRRSTAAGFWAIGSCARRLRVDHADRATRCCFFPGPAGAECTGGGPHWCRSPDSVPSKADPNRSTGDLHDEVWTPIAYNEASTPTRCDATPRG